jgi:predicted acylesterase/phospholipase RssA
VAERTLETHYDAVVFAGGGCRCFWQAGFWSIAAPALGLEPRLIGAVSAGAAMACAAASGVLEPVLEDFKRRAATNARNLYPGNVVGKERVFPHERMYRASILENIDKAAFERLRTGPEVRIFLALPPRWLGAVSGVVVGMLAYQLNRAASGQVHPTWARRLGFAGAVVPAQTCKNEAELADLILQSSCTPPMTPLYRRDGGIVLDGGLVDNVPVEAVSDSESTLVLLTRQYNENEIPDVPGRTYVQPSEPTPVAKWDYTSPQLLQETYDLGRRDGEAFAKSRASSAA